MYICRDYWNEHPNIVYNWETKYTLLSSDLLTKDRNSICKHFSLIDFFFYCFTHIHTYIIGNDQPFSYHALILYMSGGTYSLKSTPNDRFLRSFYMTILFTLRVFAWNLLRESCRRNIFILMSDLGFELGPYVW